MAKKRKSFIVQNKELLLDSFRSLNLDFIKTIIYDLLFYVILIFSARTFIGIVEKKAATVNLSQNLLGLGQEAASGLLVDIRGFFFFLIISGIIFLILMIFNFSIFKGVIWLTVGNKKANIKYIKNFFILNIIWIPAWVLAAILLAAIVEASSAVWFVAVVLILGFYFSNILYPIFIKNSRLTAIKEAFSIGTTKLHYFILPYAALIALFYLIPKAFSNIPYELFVVPAVMLIAVAWLRYYFFSIVSKIRQ